MIEITAEWDNLDTAFAELEKECEEVVRGLTISMWKSILRYTPQYEGRMAASWTYSIGAPVYADRSEMVGAGPDRGFRSFIPYQKGSRPAIEVANQMGTPSQPMRLGDVVYISNGVNHGEGPYSQDIEDGNINLRAVNRPGQPVARTLALVQGRYGADISRAAAGQLKRMRFTDGG